jgi:hypothetical protein
VAGLLALLQTQPWRFEPAAERLALELLGRELRVERLERVRLGEDIELVATGVTLGNAPWADREEMASLEHLQLTFHLPSLWREGPFVIRELVASDVQVDLQAPEDSPPNWEFDTWIFEDEDEDEEEAEESLFPLVIESANLQQLTLGYRDPDQDVTARIAGLRLGVRESDGFTELDVTGVVNDQDLSASGFIGPAPALQSGLHLKLDLQLALGELRLSARGGLADVAALAGADLDLAVNAPRARPLLDLLGLQEVRDGPLDFRGRLADARPGLVISARGSLADFDLDVDGKIEDPPNVDGVDLAFSLDGPSMAEAGAIVGLEGFKDVPYAASGRIRRQGTLLAVEGGELLAAQGRLSLDGQLPNFPDFDDWSAAVQARDLDLTVLGTLMGIDKLPAVACDIDGRLAADERGVELVDLKVSGGDMDLALGGVVGDGPNFGGTALEARFTGADMSTLGPLLATDNLPSEPFDLSGHLASFDGGWKLEDARLTSRHFTLELGGEVDRLVEPRRVLGRARFVAPDLPGALAAYGVDPPAIKPAALTLSVEAHMVAGGFRIDDLQGKLGELVFTGKGLLSTASDWVGSRLVLKTRGPDLDGALGSVMDVDVPAEPFSLALDATYHAPLIAIDRLDAVLGDHRLGAGLKLRETGDGHPGVMGQARLEGDSLGNLLALLGVEADLGEGDYSLSTSVEVTKGLIKLEDLRFEGGDSDLEGDIRLAFEDIPRLDARLHSRVLYLPFLLPNMEELAAEQEAQEAEQPAQGTGGSSALLTPPTKEQLAHRIIPDTPLPLDWINQINGNWHYRVDRAYLREDVGAKLNVALDITDGVLITRELDWLGTVSDGSAALTLDARNSANRFQFNLDSNRIPLLWLLAGYDLPTRTAIYRARISGQGATSREVAASLDGALVFNGSGVKINNLGLDLLLGALLSSVLDRINPTQQTAPYTMVECHAGAVTFDNGLVEINPGLVVRTDKVDFAVAGAADLKDETMHITFNTRARKGLGISAAKAITHYLLLAGNLAHPYLTVDPEAAVTYGGAAIATVGLSVLVENLWGRWKAATEDPCEQLFIQASKDSRGSYSALFPATE